VKAFPYQSSKGRRWHVFIVLPKRANDGVVYVNVKQTFASRALAIEWIESAGMEVFDPP